jgi:hypothetical protein
MNVDFTEAQRLLEQTQGLYPFIFGFLLAGLTIGVIAAFAADKYKFSIIFSAVTAGLIIMSASLIVAGKVASVTNEARSATVEAVTEAATNSYGLELTPSEGRALLSTLDEDSDSPEAWKTLINEKPSDKFTLYGSTEIETSNGDTITATLISRDGDFELVNLEAIARPLPLTVSEPKPLPTR